MQFLLNTKISYKNTDNKTKSAETYHLLPCTTGTHLTTHTLWIFLGSSKSINLNKSILYVLLLMNITLGILTLPVDGSESMVLFQEGFRLMDFFHQNLPTTILHRLKS